jgi:HAD superfamily hydrolase (TIGR01490 family)
LSRIIAFFDFDGTVTAKDTLLEFIKFVKGEPSFYFGFFLYSPMLILYKFNLFSNHRAKEIMLHYYFGKMKVGEFSAHCERFIKEKLPSLLRKKAMHEIKKMKDRGAEVVIVSASPENWITGWCAAENLKCIATRLHTNNDRITGKINGRNCHGKEKVNRIKEEYNLADFSAVYAYGDTPGDRYMLDIANYRFYKPFR